MKVFDTQYLGDLTAKAKTNPRLRQHQNIHRSYQDKCQRLFNAIEPGSYIRPHRHALDARDELLVAIRGAMALLVFDDQGDLISVVRFGADKHNFGVAAAVGVEVPAHTWHTVIALESGSVLLEVKAGPFDPKQPKDLAPWAPEEGAPTAESYLNQLLVMAGEITTGND